MSKTFRSILLFILSITMFDVFASTLASVTAVSLNVRDAPSGNIVTTLQKGTVVSIINISGKWAKVAYLNKGNVSDPRYGWVSINFLQLTSGGSQDINLNYGDMHLNEWTGTFATKLDGDYAIVVNADYENETMNAVIINNETGETHCLPKPCNYNY